MTEKHRIRPRAYSCDEVEKLRRETYPAEKLDDCRSQDDMSLLDQRRINSLSGSDSYSIGDFLTSNGTREVELTPMNHLPSNLSSSETPDNPLLEFEPLSPRPQCIFRHRRASIAENMHLLTLKSSSTGVSSSDGEDARAKATTSNRRLSRRRERSRLRESEASQGDREFDAIWKSFSCSFLMYLSVFSIFGSILRVFLARFFGEDCESHSVTDFLTPLSRQICVTASGRTLQTGGALFMDLPANMIGSFVMGLITPPPDTDYKLRIPWFRKDNPIQRDDMLHSAFTFGFCGSLTTFASWNSQMVVMMVGFVCR